MATPPMHHRHAHACLQRAAHASPDSLLGVLSEVPRAGRLQTEMRTAGQAAELRVQTPGL